MTEYFRPFQKFVLPDQGIEAGAIDEMIIATVHFAGPLRPRRDRYRQIDAAVRAQQ
jgi:hypothetical protein